jgi:hypothetical protein
MAVSEKTSNLCILPLLLQLLHRCTPHCSKAHHSRHHPDDHHGDHHLLHQIKTSCMHNHKLCTALQPLRARRYCQCPRACCATASAPAARQYCSFPSHHSSGVHHSKRHQIKQVDYISRQTNDVGNKMMPGDVACTVKTAGSTHAAGATITGTPDLVGCHCCFGGSNCSVVHTLLSLPMSQPQLGQELQLRLQGCVRARTACMGWPSNTVTVSAAEQHDMQRQPAREHSSHQV